MRKFFALGILALILASCAKDTVNSNPVSAYKPILMSRPNLVSSITFEGAKDINKVGKICIKDKFIYVTEPFTGVHVYDNTDPSNPANLGFIRIPGVQTISIKDNTLFADNSTDIVAIDISNPSNAIVTKRLENILPEPGVPDGLPLDAPVSASTWPANSVVVGWTNLK